MWPKVKRAGVRASHLSFSSRSRSILLHSFHFLSSSFFHATFPSVVKIVYEGLNIRRIPWGDYNSWAEVASEQWNAEGRLRQSAIFCFALYLFSTED